MTLPGYVVDDLPVRGRGAFLPSPLVQRAEVSSWGLVHVVGAPGTLPVASPKPTTSTVPFNETVLTRPNVQPSDKAPDYILPALYVASARNMGPQQGALGVRVRCTNDIPVPAVNIIRTAAVAQQPPPKLGGQRVTPWPRVFQRFPSVLNPPVMPGGRSW